MALPQQRIRDVNPHDCAPPHNGRFASWLLN
jgi:hypothetical protein